MPKLRSLPAETLSHIVSYLHLSDLVTIGRTLNKTLVDICMPRLQKRDAALRNARRMAIYLTRLRRSRSVRFVNFMQSLGLRSSGARFMTPTGLSYKHLHIWISRVVRAGSKPTSHSTGVAHAAYLRL
jgi:hypothetical protein